MTNPPRAVESDVQAAVERVRAVLVGEHLIGEQRARHFGKFAPADLRALAAEVERAGRMREAVTQARDVFADYAEMHRQKLAGDMSDDEVMSIHKTVRRNADLAVAMAAALADRASPGTGGGE